MENVEDRIRTFREMLACLDTAYFTEYGSEFEIVYSSAPHPEWIGYFFFHEDSPRPEETVGYEDDILLQVEPMPVVFADEFGMVWISEVKLKQNCIDRIYLLGPVFLDDYSVYQLEKTLEERKVSIPVKKNFLDYITALPVVSLNRFYEYGIMLHYCITGKKISVSNFVYPNRIPGDKSNEAFQQRHGTLMAEQDILRMVEEGNVNYQQIRDKYISVGDFRMPGDGKAFRREKNTVIIFTTLCSRAAIRGGLDSETAFSLCDAYVEKVERCTSLGAVTELNRQMYHDFIMRVHRQKQKENPISPQIQKACDYIGLHLEEEISIHILASKLGYTDYYFSNKFKQEMGMTLRDYLMTKRVERAQGLLLDTSMTIQEISSCLGYGSQSYFGEVFRKITGVAPSEYRNQRGVGSRSSKHEKCDE